MKSIEIIVPRMLIKKHYPHPELYGESIVELINGMVTDVYTSEEGMLFTITNEKELIKFLKKNQIDDEITRLESEEVSLSVITIKETQLLTKWKNEASNYSYNSEIYTTDMIFTYISHAITTTSCVFLISCENVEAGIVGYSIFEEEAIINLEIYEKSAISDFQIDSALKLLFEYIVQKYGIQIVSTNFFEDDDYSIRIFERNEFYIETNQHIKFPISEFKTKIGVIYKKDIAKR
ncbi:MAG: hypothetical protein PHP65_02155 [Bacilli bacterium]|nr:hypothetical protein [Bacilli bacterium]